MGSIRFFLTPKMSPNSWPTNKNDQLSHNCTKTSYSAASALDSPNISTHYMKTVDTFMTRVPYHWPVCAGGRSYLLPHFLAPPTRPNILSLIFFLSPSFQTNWSQSAKFLLLFQTEPPPTICRGFSGGFKSFPREKELVLGRKVGVAVCRTFHV